MKITAQGVELLSGILSTCMFEKGFIFSAAQQAYLHRVSEDDLESFSSIFPLEEETKEKLIALAISLGKKIVDVETVLNFFGGDLHIDHAREDVVENGLGGVLADLFLVFHVVIPVRLSKDHDQVVGGYSNGDLGFELRGLEVMESFKANLDDPNQVFLVHYGSVFGSIPTGSDEERYLLTVQSQSHFFRNVCRKIKFLDCEKMLKALQFKNRYCHTN